MRSGLSQRGMSLIEVLAVTGIAGALSLGALGATRLPSPALAVAGQETRTKDLGHLPVNLPRTVRWGLPAGTPLPPHADPGTAAATSGEAHPTITVTPVHTATATVWYLNDGRDALCIRVNDRGRVSVLRWQAGNRRWVRA